METMKLEEFRERLDTFRELWCPIIRDYCQIDKCMWRIFLRRIEDKKPAMSCVAITMWDDALKKVTTLSDFEKVKVEGVVPPFWKSEEAEDPEEP
ncbi:hypothetical protein ES703_93863 [subsurface metagenome]